MTIYIYIHTYGSRIATTMKEREKLPLQEKRLNTTKKFVTITTNVVAIGVIAMTKKSMQAVVINSETKGLCNTRFLLQ